MSSIENTKHLRRDIAIPSKSFAYRLKKDILAHWMLYLFILPSFVVIAVFSYAPMYGVQIAFRKFRPIDGILGSQWVGMANFIKFFNSRQFSIVLTNTFAINVYGLVAGFPMPILLALMLNQITHPKYKRTIQTVTYMPHFISVVVLCGMVMVYLNSNTGIYAHLMRGLGVVKPTDILADKGAFRSIYVLSGIWQHVGWDSVIYLAALAGIDPTLYEAATVDGANDLQKIRHVDLPGILPVIVILLILNLGSLMNVGFEKVLLLQNDRNLATSEVIATYVYKIGLRDQQQYSLSSAVGLFNTSINFVLLISVNYISKRLTENSLW